MTWRDACHEAGHAFAAVALGWPLWRVEVGALRTRDGKPRTGRTLYGEPAHGAPARHYMLMALAGFAGERLCAGAPPRLPSNGAGDRDAAAQILRAIGQDPGNMTPHYHAVVATLRPHAPAIRRVAELLRERGELTGDEVRAAVGHGATTPPPGR